MTGAVGAVNVKESLGDRPITNVSGSFARCCAWFEN